MTNSELLAALRSWTGPLHMSLHVTACSLRVCTLLTNARHFTSQRASCTLPRYARYARYCTLLHVTARSLHATARHSTLMHATARHGTLMHATARHGMLLHATAHHCTLPARCCYVTPSLPCDNWKCHTVTFPVIACLKFPKRYIDDILEDGSGW